MGAGIVGYSPRWEGLGSRAVCPWQRPWSDYKLGSLPQMEESEPVCLAVVAPLGWASRMQCWEVGS